MASPVIQVKRGLYSNLPALKSGEPGFTTDKYDLFVGLDETLGNNQFFGSGRYWEREDGTNAAQLKLVDKDGSNGINLQVPDTTAGIGTWILPLLSLNLKVSHLMTVIRRFQQRQQLKIMLIHKSLLKIWILPVTLELVLLTLIVNLSLLQEPQMRLRLLLLVRL